MSPVWRERRTGMPFDAMRKRRPDWVPEGILTLVFPLSMVGTSNPPAGAAAHRAGLRLGAGLRAGTGTGLAGDRNRDLDLGGLAEEGFLQRDFHVVAQIGAALAPAATPALPAHAEQVFEDI